jgi:hypothetical protein
MESKLSGKWCDISHDAQCRILSNEKISITNKVFGKR